MAPYIVGTLQLGEHTIYLDRVRGIYADRASPRKAGYWVKTFDADTNRIMKTFHEGLSQQDRLMIAAASQFNQAVEGILYQAAQ